MAEFRRHHVIARLLQLLGAGEAGNNPAYYAELLSAVTTTPTTWQESLETLQRHVDLPGGFYPLLDDIRSTQSREMAPVLYILAKAAEDPALAKMLSDTDAAVVTTHTERAAATSSTAIDDLRRALVAATSEKTTTTTYLEPVEVDMDEEMAKRRRQRALDALPAVPEWQQSRPFMGSDFPSIERAAQSAAVPLSSLPRDLQELALLDDLLFLLMGVEGKYIHVVPRTGEGDVGFTTESSIDVSFKEMIARIVVVCSHYSAISHYVDNNGGFRSGRVNQALSSAMRTLLKDYLVLVAQMEHQFKQGSLTLQRMWFYLQPCIHTLEVVGSIARNISAGECRGAAVLTLLHERLLASLGDTSEEELCRKLAEAACVPFFDMLEKWIHKGIVDDACCEFMIEEDTSVTVEMTFNDAYWEKHYTVVHERVPVFLSDCADKILKAGKYLNVIRQSGRVIPYEEVPPLVYSMRDRVYGERVEVAFRFSSRLLLDLLMGDMQLKQRLLSMKRYFLMSQGDFFVHLVDMARDELSKNLEDIQMERMSALIELAQRTSTAASDRYKDDLQCGFAPYNLVTELFRIMNVSHDFKGHQRMDQFFPLEAMSLDQEPDMIRGRNLLTRCPAQEAFTLDYTVRWPVLLVLSRKAIKKYQLLFRHLFHCANIHRTLSDTWREHQKITATAAVPPAWLTLAYELRQRMIHFVHNLQHYACFEVVEPNWQKLEKQLGEATAIDDVLRDHNDFLDTCIKECLLTNPVLIKTISKILSVCEIFASYMKRFVNSMAPGGRDHDDKPYEKTIERFRENFAGLMDKLLAGLTQRVASGVDQHTVGLVTRLDFNGFYSKSS